MASTGYQCTIKNLKGGSPATITHSYVIYHREKSLNGFVSNIGIMGNETQLFINHLMHMFLEKYLYLSPIKGMNLGARLVHGDNDFKYLPECFLCYVGFGEFKGNNVDTDFVTGKLSRKGYSLYSLNKNAILDKTGPNGGSDRYNNKVYICRMMQYDIDKKGGDSYSSKYFDEILKNLMSLNQQGSTGQPVDVGTVGAVEIEVNDHNDLVKYVNMMRDAFSSPNVTALVPNEPGKDRLSNLGI